MNRRSFLQTITMLPLTGAALQLNELEKISAGFNSTNPMPVLFMGHGSPMNAIEENEFVRGWRNVGKTLPKPEAILCISAHWETKGTFVTAMQQPKTIHDFGGFPEALFQVQYPAPGSPELAKATKDIILKSEVGLDQQWGLDHGCWSVVRRLYPDADIPVIQLSLDYSQSPQYHYDLAKQLAALRQRGVLIIGSGNMIHNLGMVAWDRLNSPGFGYDWAIEANEKMKQLIINGNHESLIKFKSMGRAFDLSIPTSEHFLPLLYVLALQNKQDALTFFNDQLLAGSLSMTSVKIG